MVKLRKEDREALAAVAAGQVFYQPGRERWTGAPTQWSYKRYVPSGTGFKNWKRCKAPVNRLVEAGLAEHVSAERYCQVTLTEAGRAQLAATEGNKA